MSRSFASFSVTRAASRARHRSRIASSSTVGTYTAVRSPDREQPRELDGIAAVGLHLVPRPPRDQRRRHDVTRQPLPREIAIQPVPTRAGLVDEPQRGRPSPAGVESADPGRPGGCRSRPRTRAAPLGPPSHARPRSSPCAHPTRRKSGVDFAMADLREYSAADSAAVRLWPAG